MKTSKSELAFFILSLITIALAVFIYFLFGTRFNHSNTSQPRTVQTSKSSETKDDTSSETSDQITKADTLLAQFENANDRALSTAVQEAINDIPDSDKEEREKLQERLNADMTDLDNQETATQKVDQADSLRTSDAVLEAQSAIDTIKNATQKAELQARLDPIKAAVDTATGILTTE